MRFLARGAAGCPTCAERKTEPGRAKHERKSPLCCRLFGHKWCALFVFPLFENELPAGAVCTRCGAYGYRCDHPVHGKGNR